MNILIAEDEEKYRKDLQNILFQQGHEITAVENGQQAKEQLETFLFDVVFCDMFLPELSGKKLYEWVLKNNPEQNFIFMCSAPVPFQDVIVIEHPPTKEEVLESLKKINVN